MRPWRGWGGWRLCIEGGGGAAPEIWGVFNILMGRHFSRNSANIGSVSQTVLGGSQQGVGGPRQGGGGGGVFGVWGGAAHEFPRSCWLLCAASEVAWLI